MTLQSSGPIYLSQIAAELGISAAGLTLNDPRCRALAGKLTDKSPISLADFYGKSNNPGIYLTSAVIFTGNVQQTGFANSVAGAVSPTHYKGYLINTINQVTGITTQGDTYITVGLEPDVNGNMPPFDLISRIQFSDGFAMDLGLGYVYDDGSGTPSTLTIWTPPPVPYNRGPLASGLVILT